MYFFVYLKAAYEINLYVRGGSVANYYKMYKTSEGWGLFYSKDVRI